MEDTSQTQAQTQRAELVATAITLLESEGHQALTPERLASQADLPLDTVTEFFQTSSDLQMALTAEGYRRFAASMAAEMASAPNTARAKLLAAGQGYAKFAAGSPSLFRQIFSAEANERINGEVLEAMGEAYDILSSIALPYGVKDTGGRRIAEMRIWALMHGYASLFVGKNALFADTSDLEALLAGILPEFDSV